MLVSLFRWKAAKKSKTSDHNKPDQSVNTTPQDGTVCVYVCECEQHEVWNSTLTNLLRNPCHTSEFIFWFIYAAISFKIPLTSVRLTDRAVCVPFQSVEFHRPWAKRGTGEREREKKKRAKVITWFRLSWFWFRKGRVCQKHSRHSPDLIPCQVFEEKSERGMEMHRERRERNRTKRDRDGESRPMPIKWTELKQHKETKMPLRKWVRKREKGEGSGRLLTMNEFLIALRSAIAGAQTEINTLLQNF